MNKLELTRREMLVLFGVAAAIKTLPASAAPLAWSGESSLQTAGASHTLRLADVDADLEQLLNTGSLPGAKFPAMSIRFENTMVAMRDGVRLATDLYLPPELPAPVVAVRTPYGRDRDSHVPVFMSYARRGYVVVAQDCRGTGGSEPDSWDYYMYESEDGYDFVDWVSKQPWYGGFIGSIGGSYEGQTQWPMAMHPSMSAIVPTVSGLGIAVNTVHLYMFINAYAHVIGKGADKIAIPYTQMERVFEKETMAGGYFNEPLHKPLPEDLLDSYPKLRNMPSAEAKRSLWEHYAGLPSKQRAEFVKQALGVQNVTSMDVEALPVIFGHTISHDAHTIPHASQAELCQLIKAPPLLWTGWYDWALNDALATWEIFRREARPEVAGRARLLITPYAHNMPGYHEGVDRNPELMRQPGVGSQVGALLRWYAAVREGNTDSWPTVIYYLMGANEWRVASDWPVPAAKQTAFYLGSDRNLTSERPHEPSQPEQYTYDPKDPTPTVGGSIVSFLYPPGSVDVSEAQKRPDVLVYTTPVLKEDLDVVGPLRMILFASSSAVDTDFAARLSDLFPDGRAVQIQSGMLRARYRNLQGEPELLEPGRVYRFEIDLWHTAARFKAGHRLRVDISSADFPHFDRNANLGGKPGEPIPARQTIYHDPDHPSHLLVSVLV
jgi:predicted acyl esterase